MHASRCDGSKRKPRCQQHDQNEHSNAEATRSLPSASYPAMFADFRCNHQPTTTILYASRMITVDTEIQLDIL